MLTWTSNGPAERLCIPFAPGSEWIELGFRFQSEVNYLFVFFMYIGYLLLVLSVQTSYKETSFRSSDISTDIYDCHIRLPQSYRTYSIYNVISCKGYSKGATISADVDNYFCRCGSLFSSSWWSGHEDHDPQTVTMSQIYLKGLNHYFNNQKVPPKSHEKPPDPYQVCLQINNK